MYLTQIGVETYMWQTDKNILSKSNKENEQYWLDME